MDYLTTPTNLSPIWRGFAPGFVNYKKGYTRLAAASDKVYQLLAHGRWFSPGTPASSTTKTGRHDIAEILLKVELNTKNHHQIILMIPLIPTSVRPAKVLAHGRWFSPGTQASSTTKTGRHDIAEILLKHNKSNQINQIQQS